MNTGTILDVFLIVMVGIGLCPAGILMIKKAPNYKVERLGTGIIVVGLLLILGSLFYLKFIFPAGLHY